jgi:nitrogen fixation protein FixH
MKLKPGALWPFIIAGALGLHVVGSMVMVYFATSNESYTVEPDYYQKALNWNDKRAQDRSNAELGWQLEFTVEPARAGQDPTLSVELTSADGESVTGATVAVEAFANARRDDVLTATVMPSESGYRTTMPMRRDGLWEFRFTVTRGDDLFTYRDMRHVWTELPQ